MYCFAEDLMSFVDWHRSHCGVTVSTEMAQWINPSNLNAFICLLFFTTSKSCHRKMFNDVKCTGYKEFILVLWPFVFSCDSISIGCNVGQSLGWSVGLQLTSFRSVLQTELFVNVMADAYNVCCLWCTWYMTHILYDAWCICCMIHRCTMCFMQITSFKGVLQKVQCYR